MRTHTTLPRDQEEFLRSKCVALVNFIHARRVLFYEWAEMLQWRRVEYDPRAGVLGGYTTFSTYMVETHGLVLAGRIPMALLYMFGSLVAGVLLAQETVLQLTEAVVASAERKYGSTARTRLQDWVKLVAENKKKPDADKLRLVNDFFNKTPFDSDIEHWGKRDYWATPVELLASNGGDCEDYAIAKYFSLLALGFPIDKLRITYVKALNQPVGDQAHMVLTYFAKADAIPLVLDNLVPEIKPASQRSDLLPVYSFNGDGLWLAKERGSGRPGQTGQVGGAGQISLWKEMMARMGQEL